MPTDTSIQAIEAELQELAGNDQKVTVRLDTKLKFTSSTRFTDKQIKVRLNPKKITTRTILDKQLERIRKDIVGGAL